LLISDHSFFSPNNTTAAVNLQCGLLLILHTIISKIPLVKRLFFYGVLFYRVDLLKTVELGLFFDLMVNVSLINEFVVKCITCLIKAYYLIVFCSNIIRLLFVAQIKAIISFNSSIVPHFRLNLPPLIQSS
jgi:hypothetical protein